MARLGKVTSSPAILLTSLLSISFSLRAAPQQSVPAAPSDLQSRLANENVTPWPESPTYRNLQTRLAHGWNTWDVHSVTTQVLLPQGLAIHIGMKHNSTLADTGFLDNTLIGRLSKGAEVVFPGPHSWDGSYTDLRVTWKEHNWRIQSAHDGNDLVLLATPLPPTAKTESVLPPTIVFSVNFLWDQPGTTLKLPGAIETHFGAKKNWVYCTCELPGDARQDVNINLPVSGSYFAADFTAPVGLGTGKRRTLAKIEAAIERGQTAYKQSTEAASSAASPATTPMVDAIETTLGWDTIYDPEKHRVISPITRLWSVDWGGWVLADWDTFFAATLAGVGDRDLAYANTIEMLHEETAAGFVPNYSRPDGWKSFDRSEPPVGSITAHGLYNKYHDKWFLEETFAPLLKWNRWWAEHRDIQGYLTWGSDGENQPRNFDDDSVGTRGGAILESGLDNSPMYDKVTYNSETHLLEMGDVGLMSMYVADCNALATIADILNKSAEARELRDRSARYRAKLETMWDNSAGIFLNKDLHTGESGRRLSPTNFYPMMAKVATPEQAKIMIEKHLLNPNEFWGDFVIPSIERDDPAFKDQDYWRGRIWGPMNYLVYLGLLNYDDTAVRRDFAQKSYALFLKEWNEKGHVHENYNGATGAGDDVNSSDRFYHWGALLAYIEYMELSTGRAQPANQ
jgi:putative isomerase